jgi:hypothetical protein
MPDTFDSYVANPASAPPKAKTILDAMPKISGGGTSLCLSDKALRALLDVIATLG